jgi:hypothetical protein
MGAVDAAIAGHPKCNHTPKFKLAVREGQQKIRRQDDRLPPPDKGNALKETKSKKKHFFPAKA